MGSESIPLQAIIFISVIALLLLVLLLFCMYLNKMVCFASCGGCNCFEEKKGSKQKEKKAQLGDSYGYEDDDDSSSDSDNEMLLRYEHFISSKTTDGIRSKQPSLRFKSATSLRNGGARVDDISLTEQGGAQGSTVSLDQYRDEPEDTRIENGDDTLLVAEEPVPEDLLANQESSPTIGHLEVAFDYSGESSRMNVTVIRGLELPAKDKGGASAWRLRILLYPKKQRTKTRIRETEEPVFKELFRFTRIRPHEIVNSAIRFRLYAAERMRKERLIGEGLVKFSSLNTSAPQTVMVKLVSRSETESGGTGNASPYSSSSDISASGDSSSSLPSLAHGGLPEILVGLTYNATTGRLAVELIKGSHFKQHAAGRAPDSYVRISLLSSSGFEMTKSKTSVRRGQPNPTFKETFIFQVAQFQLCDVTLMFTVFNKRGMKRKETIGWVTMGLSNSSDEEAAHWKEMRESKSHQVCRWHALSNK